MHTSTNIREKSRMTSGRSWTRSDPSGRETDILWIFLLGGVSCLTSLVLSSQVGGYHGEKVCEAVAFHHSRTREAISHIMRICISTITALAVAVAPVQAFLVPSKNKISQSTTFLHTSTKPSDSVTSSSECDDVNTPPSLSIILRSLEDLPSGSDLRGRFVDHSRVGSIANVAHAIGAHSDGLAPLTPLAAHCVGNAFAKLLKERLSASGELVVALGRDPRLHGRRLCDAFARGVETVEGVRVQYTGVATTPAMFEFCR